MFSLETLNQCYVKISSLLLHLCQCLFHNQIRIVVFSFESLQPHPHQCRLFLVCVKALSFWSLQSQMCEHLVYNHICVVIFFLLSTTTSLTIPFSSRVLQPLMCEHLFCTTSVSASSLSGFLQSYPCQRNFLLGSQRRHLCKQLFCNDICVNVFAFCRPTLQRHLIRCCLLDFFFDRPSNIVFPTPSSSN